MRDHENKVDALKQAYFYLFIFAFVSRNRHSLFQIVGLGRMSYAIVIDAENISGKLSSNSSRGCLYSLRALRKDMNLTQDMG